MVLPASGCEMMPNVRRRATSRLILAMAFADSVAAAAAAAAAVAAAVAISVMVESVDIAADIVKAKAKQSIISKI